VLFIVLSSNRIFRKKPEKICLVSKYSNFFFFFFPYLNQKINKQNGIGIRIATFQTISNPAEKICSDASFLKHERLESVVFQLLKGSGFLEL